MYQKDRSFHGGRGREHMEIQEKNGTKENLRELLRQIDHRSYPAYKELKGSYSWPLYRLNIDHVQGDPFASPSALRIQVRGAVAGFPLEWAQKECTSIALCDDLLRRFQAQIRMFAFRAGGSGKSGLISCSKPGQEILRRSAVELDRNTGDVTVRFYVGFPAAGRTILAEELDKICFDFLPKCVERSLIYKNLKQEEVIRVIHLAEDQEALRLGMEEKGLAAFVADNSILPRESGVSQKPMKDAIPFLSPESMRVSFCLPHKGKITGMGIKKGITLIIGGGYHGKSTLLKALERGVYNHIPGDGREFCLTDPTAVKVRAEDGRCVHKTDISSFINRLPNKTDTKMFSTPDASGSTSQAAAVIEAIESGAKLLLMDEDTCATNFMVRDELMQQIVSPKEETITPFVDQMKNLYEKTGLSMIIALGSSGAFFEPADQVIRMDQYRPYDETPRVREVLAKWDKSGENGEAADFVMPDFSLRCPKAGQELFGRDGRVRHKTMGKDGLSIGHEQLDLRGVEQIVDEEQTECLAQLLVTSAGAMDGRTSVREIVRHHMDQIRQKGLAGAVQGKQVPGNLALAREQEFYAALNRCRMISMR